MSRLVVRIALSAAVLGLAAPAAVADAARPVKGTYFDGDPAHGAYLETTSKGIRQLSLYCRQPEYDDRQDMYEFRASRYDIYAFIRVGRGGRFSYRGKVNRFGPEGQPLGRFTVRLSGRFVSRDRVVIKRRAAGCTGGPTASAARR